MLQKDFVSYSSNSTHNNSCIVISKLDLKFYGCPCCGKKDKMSPTFSQKKNCILFFECPHCANPFITVQTFFKDVLSINIQGDTDDFYFSFVNNVRNHPFQSAQNFENPKDYFYSEMIEA